MMHYLIAPDSFKESMTAIQAANAIEKGILKIDPSAKCIKIPMADGGEGTTRALVESTGGTLHKACVLNPIGVEIEAEYGILGDGKTAVLEMASASGLQLLALAERNPLITTSYGTGQLIQAALSHPIERLLIGIGGSATNDGGVGMLQALGVQLTDSTGNALPFGGGTLEQLHHIDCTNLDPRLKQVEILVACDVQNPLIGPMGASVIYGPQKGATPEMVVTLERNLTHFAKVIEEQLHQSVQFIPGSGAAGGLGAALLAFLDASLISGIDLVIQYARLENALKTVDFVITGEGRIDGQTVFGKTLYGIGNLAKTYDIPVIALAGKIEKGSEKMYQHGITAMFSISPEPCDLETALNNGPQNLMHTTESIVRLIQAFQAFPI